MAAIVYGLDHFKQYLKHYFTIICDNSVLTWRLNNLLQIGKTVCWIEKSKPLKFKIQHIKGTNNVIADCLSRLFEGESGPRLREKGKINVLVQVPEAFTHRRKPRHRQTLIVLKTM